MMDESNLNYCFIFESNTAIHEIIVHVPEHFGIGVSVALHFPEDFDDLIKVLLFPQADQ